MKVKSVFQSTTYHGKIINICFTSTGSTFIVAFQYSKIPLIWRLIILNFWHFSVSRKMSQD